MREIAPALLRQLNETAGRLLNGVPGSHRSDAINGNSVTRRPPGKTKEEDFALPHPEADLPSEVEALRKGMEYLLPLQREEGYWEGKVYDNVTITAEYVMFLRFLHRLDSTTAEKSKKTILECQLPDGGWNIYGGGPSDHSATVEAYFALKLCGLTSRHHALVRARKLILERGGIPTTRVFTKINLAMFGLYPWSRIPIINPELMLLPRKAPINIYEFSSWSRAVIIPLLIIFDKKPVCDLPRAQHLGELGDAVGEKRSKLPIARLLRRKHWTLEQIFELVQSALGIYEKIPLKPLRKKALADAEKWILNHQDECGSWCGIYPAMANSIVALHLRGRSLSDPVLKKGLSALRSYAEETKETLRMQSTTSPIWDAAITSYAFQEAGLSPAHESIAKCTNWLLGRQILDVYGDWRFKGRAARPGGWPFELENSHYPDIDDSALAILALLPSERLPKKSKEVTFAIDRGIEWLLGMQGSDGGWGAFDRDNNRQLLNEIPFADLKSLLDPSSPDVTGHVIEALGAASYERYSQPVDRAIEYLEKSQESNGSWYGRWGVNYIYGTSAVLSGLAIAGENMNRTYVQHASKWLEKTQNSDGGWGESCASYDEGKYLPLGNSTASQTAWALLGLLSVPKSNEAVVRRGIDYLVKTQESDGRWDEPEWTGTGFPKHFYLRYDYYRLYWPVMALGRYVKRHQKSNPRSTGNA